MGWPVSFRFCPCAQQPAGVPEEASTCSSRSTAKQVSQLSRKPWAHTSALSEAPPAPPAGLWLCPLLAGFLFREAALKTPFAQTALSPSTGRSLLGPGNVLPAKGIRIAGQSVLTVDSGVGGVLGHPESASPLGGASQPCNWDWPMIKLAGRCRSVRAAPREGRGL